MQAASPEIVAIEGNVEQAGRRFQLQQRLQAVRQPGAAAVDADQLRVGSQMRLNLAGQLSALRLCIGKREKRRVRGRLLGRCVRRCWCVQ